MAYLTVKNKRLHILGEHNPPREYTSVNMAAQGVFTHLKKTRNEYPLDPYLARQLMRRNPDLEISPLVSDLIESHRDKLTRSQKILESPARIFHPKSRPDQNVGSEWLLFNKRVILGDEQGNGKTVTSLICLNAMEKDIRVLIIAPQKKLKDWKEHVEQWTSLKAVILNGSPLHRESVLEGYTTGVIVSGYNTAMIHASDLTKFDVVIVDEAHKLRNRKTKFYTKLKRVCHTAEYLFLLTASPIINGSDDLWTLLNLINPQRFPAYWVFVYKFFHVYEELFGIRVGEIRSEARPLFNALIKEFILTRMNTGRSYEVKKRLIRHEMKGDQLELYQDMANKMECTYGVRVVEAQGTLSMITRCRQLCLHPGLVFPEYPIDGPSKLHTLLDVLRERQSPTVVFTEFAKLTELAKKFLELHGISALTLTGGSKGDPASEFQDGEADVILVTHGSGGEGLNLHRADRVIFLDIDWHPDGNTQAYKRIDRPAVQKAPFIEVIFIRAVDSVEKHIYAINRRKQPVTLAAIAREMSQ